MKVPDAAAVPPAIAAAMAGRHKHRARQAHQRWNA